MATITTAEVIAAFEAAMRVQAGQVQAGAAAKQLNAATGLSPGSAKNFFAQLKHMLRGEVFKRALSAEALEYFLKSILRHYGHSYASSALVATWKHIAYYEAHYRTHLRTHRSIAAKFEAELSLTAEILPLVEAKFAAAVSQALNEPETTRQASLRDADPQPPSRLVSVRVFDRNPHVVAAVLLRAGGVCEVCHSPAPFLRASDGTPYLEVHHRDQLANGGPDTVANAIALCPNCHRQAHHGEA